MARDQVLVKAFQNPAFRAVRRTAQALFAQLVTQGAPNTAGILPLMPAKWAAGCDEISEASVKADLAVLSSAGLVVVDATTFEVMIRQYIRDTGVARHTNHFKGALNCAEEVESPLLRSVLALELERIGDPLGLEVAERLTPATDPDPIEMASQSHPNGIGVPSGSEAEA